MKYWIDGLPENSSNITFDNGVVVNPRSREGGNKLIMTRLGKTINNYFYLTLAEVSGVARVF